MFGESSVFRSIRGRLVRRGLLIGAAATGAGALAAGMRGAGAQPTPGPGGIEWLDYTPPRRYAAGARVGNIVYLAGETGQDLTTGTTVSGGIGPQTQLAFENIRHNLRLVGSDLQYIFRITTYLVNMSDISVYAQTRARFLPRAVPATTVAVSALAFPELLIEIEATALVPGR
jgi:2-iminobutanoate/2-iminopropanoate deaminase